MTSPCAVGVDVGGTFVKLGLVQGHRILTQRALPTASIGSTPRKLQEGLVKAVGSLVRESRRRITGVGVGIPGWVQYPEGVVRSCANLPGWKDVPLRALLSRRLHLPVSVDNDVNVMTLAEWTAGAGRGARNLVCVTLGTGVGGGLILDGRLYRGWNGFAGEIGHIPVAEAGPRCSCGGIACLERYVGNREILQRVRDQLKQGVASVIPELVGGDLRRLTPEVIDRACELGDPLGRQTWRWVGTQIGLVLIGVVNLLNPERIVVGGGISKAGRWLFEPMRKTVRRRAVRGASRFEETRWSTWMR
ncbi:MAG: ROK family protein [Candidatus Omnitrophica bacterium]|nr:ROK family protein [Candidatus Omnitrophota bacterium]